MTNQKCRILIYGATGYAGRLIAEECIRRAESAPQLVPILAGRSEEKLQAIAEKLATNGVKCETRVFSLDAAARYLDDVRVVLHCAGPFSETASSMMRACIDSGTHYLDISGEIEVFQAARVLHATAQNKRIILCPGAGFDIVPTDCLSAKLKEALPDAHTINLAFTFGTMPSVGTLNTVIEGLALGGLVRRNGLLKEVGNGYRIRKIPFQDKRRWCVSIPWADVYTAGISTSVPNGMVLTAMPWLACQFLRGTSPMRGMLANPTAETVLKQLCKWVMRDGPDRKQRMQDRCQVWGEAIGNNGQSLTATLSAPNVYDLTVDAALGMAEHCLRANEQFGFFTASQLMGAAYGLTLPDCNFKLNQSP